MSCFIEAIQLMELMTYQSVDWAISPVLDTIKFVRQGLVQVETHCRQAWSQQVQYGENWRVNTSEGSGRKLTYWTLHSHANP